VLLGEVTFEGGLGLRAKSKTQCPWPDQPII
jgi:hypothetical protein